MFPIQRLLAPDCVRARLPAASRKRALEHASEILASAYDLNPRDLLDAMLARERLGSTALGDGVALPHARLEGCAEPIAVLLTLEKPIDYDAPDDAAVDLLFALIVPKAAADEHLSILSNLAELLVEEPNREALRAADSHEDLFRTINDLTRGRAA
ncbi:MAG: PTS sugar transporter subunit IIA [Pseudomonadota bacterium]